MCGVAPIVPGLQSFVGVLLLLRGQARVVCWAGIGLLISCGGYKPREHMYGGGLLSAIFVLRNLCVVFQFELKVVKR